MAEKKTFYLCLEDTLKKLFLKSVLKITQKRPYEVYIYKYVAGPYEVYIYKYVAGLLWISYFQV